MALLISKQTESGSTAEYFNIENVSVDKSGLASVLVNGYISKSAREAIFKPVLGMNFSVPFDLSEASPLWSEIYIELKNTDYFAGATDDL